jgi:ATP-dependent Clp protease ATP-binding subunit ClpA
VFVFFQGASTHERVHKKNFNIKKGGHPALLYSFLITNIVAVSALASNSYSPPSAASALTSYTTDLTQLGRDGRLRENLNLEKETVRLIKVLAGNGKRQPVLIDEKGENQDFVVEQLAIRIANGDVADKLAGTSVLKLETATLYSKRIRLPKPRQRSKRSFNEILLSKKPTILFVNELSTVIATGTAGAKLLENVANGKLKGHRRKLEGGIRREDR